MCVTAGPANITGTRTYVFATELDGRPVHVCGYQNRAQSLVGGNCMFLNFAGSDLRLVRGPERTRYLMDDLTSGLPELVPAPRTLGGTTRMARPALTVEDYGDYTVLLAQSSVDILSVLDEVPAHRRPQRGPRLKAMVDYYRSTFPRDSFVLACFDGSVEPTHPITVSYTPNDPDVLIAPGLDGHDGDIPMLDQPMPRDFRVAFAIGDLHLPVPVNYRERWIGEQPWAPSRVAGFVDNRPNGLNRDYVVELMDIQRGLSGSDLVDLLL